MGDEHEIEIEVEVPVGATPEQREALIQKAIDDRVDGDLDKMLGGLFK